MATNGRMQISPSAAWDPAVGVIAINVAGGDQDLSLTTTGRRIYVGTAGNLSCIMHDGSSATFSNLAAGVIYDIAVRKILQTGTTIAGNVLL